jgi:hypothetical protein
MIPVRSEKQRGGSIVVCVLVCLLVASTMVTVTTTWALRSRREVRLGHQMRQTELLLDAGVLRAARRLQDSSDYQGESWRPAAAITRFDNALVEIRVTADEQDSASRRVEVIASLGFSADDVQPIRVPLTRRTHVFRSQPSKPSPATGSPIAE